MDNQSESTQSGPKSTVWVVILVLIVIVSGGVYYFLSQDSGTGANNANVTVNTPLNSNGSVNANANQNGNSAVNENSNIDVNTNSSSNANADTSGWSTYSNEQYSFSINYPQTWLDSSYEEYNGESAFVLVFETGRTDSERFPFLSIKQNWDAEQEQERINNIDPPYTTVTQSESITIGQLDATRLTYESTIGLSFQRIIIIYNNTAFMFDSLKDDSEFEAVVETITFQ